MFFVSENIVTTIYLISYITLSNLVCLGLLLGLISRLIIQYFENEFMKNRNFKEN